MNRSFFRRAARFSSYSFLLPLVLPLAVPLVARAQTQELPPAEPAATQPLPKVPENSAPPAVAPLASPALIPDIKLPFEVVPPENTPFAESRRLPAPSDGLPQISPPIATGQEPPGGQFTLQALDDKEPELIYLGEQKLIISEKPVRLSYGKFSVVGDRLVIDSNKNLATLTGKLDVKSGDQTLTGRTLTYDIDSGIWQLFDLEKTFPPEFFPSQSVIEPIFVRGAKITGAQGRVTGTDFSVSSCKIGHYYILSREVRFYRDSEENPTRIVLRRNSIYVLGKRIVPLPVFSVNLNSGISRRVPLQPIVGQNSYDGVFVKSTYSLAANSKRTDNILIDLLQKRGLGLGFNRELAAGAGVFYLYALSGKSGGRQIDSRINRIWKISKPLTATLNFQSTQNSSAGFTGSSRNSDVSFIYERPNVQSNLLLRSGQSDSGGSGFKDFGLTLQHRQTIGKLSIDAGTVYSANSYGAGNESKTMDNTVLLNWRQKRLDVFLRAENHDDLTGTNQRNGAYQLERLPEFGFVTDTSRTKIPFFSKFAPGNLALGFGEFNEPSSGQKLMRTAFTYNFNPRTLSLLKRGSFKSELTAVGRFEQAFYSNNTARYNYDTFLNFNNELGRASLRLNYIKQQFRGFTPFQFDFLFPSESVDATMAYRLADKFDFELTGGQDLENNVARDVVTQIRYRPKKSIFLSFGANYSRETSQFGDIVSNLHYERPNKRFLQGSLDLGVRYSAQSNKLSRVNAAADVAITKKTRIQALGSYNGFSSAFDFAQIRLTRDLHCFNLYATYDQQRKEFRLDLALKAFPFFDSRFGRNDSGTGFSPYFGQIQ